MQKNGLDDVDKKLRQFAKQVGDNEEKDLAKLSDERVQEADKIKTARNKSCRVALAFCCMLVIVVGIITPIMFLPTKDNTPPVGDEPSYSDTIVGDVLTTDVDNIEELDKIYKMDCMVPVVDAIYTQGYVLSLSENPDRKLGRRYDTFVGNEYIELFQLVVVDYDFEYKDYKDYENNKKIFTWKEYELRYEMYSGSYYPHIIYFTDGKYKYYLGVKTYKEIIPIEMMNIIFGE